MGLSLPIEIPTAFSFHTYTPLSIPSICLQLQSLASDSFLCFMAAPGVAPGIQEQLQDLEPKKAG